MGDDLKVALAVLVTLVLAAEVYHGFPTCRLVRRLLVGPRAPVYPDPLTPYVAHFALPAGAGPVRVTDHLGLLYAEPAVPDGTVPGAAAYLRTVWRDRDAYLAGVAGFQSAANVAGPVWTGYHGGVAERGKPLLLRVKTWVVVLCVGLTSVAGYFMTVHESWGKLAGEPKFQATFEPSIDVMVKKKFRHVVEVRNVCTTPAECDFVFDRFLVTDVKGRPLTEPKSIELNPPSRAFATGVRRGDDTKVEVSGRGMEPGEYLIVLHGSASAGILYPHKTQLLAVVAKVQVWKDVSVRSTGVPDDCDNSASCLAAFEIAPGRDWDALVIQCDMDEPGVVFGGQVFLTGSSGLQVFPNTRGGSYTFLKFTTPPLKAMNTEPFTVRLVSTTGPRSREQWRKVAAKLSHSHEALPPKPDKENPP